MQIGHSYYDHSRADNASTKESLQKRDNPNELTPKEEAHIKKLEAEDQRVRTHEAAHIAAGGGVVTGGASFEYAQGPDGKLYAVGGEVGIDTSEGNSPEESIQKARQIAAAAMAPADPSPQDFRVAASATIMEMRALAQKAKEQEEKDASTQIYKEASKQEN
ncbi:MAG: putative metalloprotease CJM1_0395 family protein [Sulfuricurvum sp.]